MASTGMIIDGVFASEAIDSSGEILHVDGCDITDLEEGRGTLNYEHRGDDAPGASPNDVIGKILFAKKIFSAKDCANDRELSYWKQVELPFIYGIVRLYDGAGHPGAIAAAAQIRDHVANDEKILMRFSIEGTTLKQEGKDLLQSVARRVALTQKPCNRSCDSGVLEDPNAPAGFKKKPEDVEKDFIDQALDAKKSEHHHPNYTPLGGAKFVECNPIVPEPDVEGAIEHFQSVSKALTASSYNAAPSTLTGGAALQREHVIRGWANRAKAALRDYKGPTKEFRAFLKFRLPEVSDQFLDRFADMVETHRFTKADLAKAAPKLKAPPREMRDTEESVDDNAVLTIRGKPAPLPNVQKPTFDEKSGTLHTPRGSFKVYVPSHDKTPGAREAFHNILSDPKATEVHDYALRNWKRVHTLLKQGKLPEEVVMHSTIFSQLSPNTPVPNQELMYGHLVDAMRHTGVDARSPEFSNLREEWKGRDQPDKYPDLATDHFQAHDSSLRIARDSRLTDRKAGDIGSFMLADNKFKNMEQYHGLHSKLVDLVQRHRTDARSAVSELMDHKNKGQLWEARRKREKEKGRGDIGEYEGVQVPGLAPKTARYMYGMLGGGNVVVPDTHFIRYLFGLEKGHASQPVDNNSINYLKNVLWNERAAPIMEGIDRYYAQHHDAVKHLQNHPNLRGFDAEDLVFPAFWKNWMAIVPHEKHRGMQTGGFNEFTDHRPFWEAIEPIVQKHGFGKVAKAEASELPLPMRTAAAMREIADTHGDNAAMLAYYAYLIPHLLGDGRVDTDAIVRKFESWSIDLRKAARDVQKAKATKFAGKNVRAGKALVGGKPHAVLHDDGERLVVVDAEKFGQHGPKDLKRVKRGAVAVHEAPTVSTAVDSTEHGNFPAFNRYPEQHELIHGMDFGTQEAKGPTGAVEGVNSGASHWRKTATGDVAYVKAHGNRDVGYDMDPAMSEPRREVLYHNLAHDFFGMGQYVPRVALLKHPETGQEHAVIERVKGKHLSHDRSSHKVLEPLAASGELDKLALMNMLSGNDDRHVWNYMVDDKGGLKLIDHGFSFGHGQGAEPPTYWTKHGDWKDGERPLDSWKHERLHPKAVEWALGLDEKKLDSMLQEHGLPTREREFMLMKLQKLQERLNTHDNTTKWEAHQAPWLAFGVRIKGGK